MIIDPILADLNPPQQEAVLHSEGPLLILAGAGSGKTRVITRRIAYLIARRGVQPWQILAVTFTNKAADEMRKRVEQLLGARGLSVALGTFHSTCVRILRKWHGELGLRSSFVIYDDGDQLSVVKDCLRAANLSERVMNPRGVLARISRAKNDLLGPGEYAALAADFMEERTAKLYAMYQERLRASHAVDFDDLLMLTVRLLQDRPQVLEYYHNLWRYFLVDEYQDTNRAQYQIVNALSARHGNLCVVGDDDQSIYRWRGADLNNILDFERDHPGCTVIRLEQNYRSTQTILDASGGVVANNVGRKGKRLWTENPVGEPVVIYEATDEQDEADFVVRVLKGLAAEHGHSLDDFAIFYRTNAQSRVIEDALRRELTPYVIVGGLRFYERKEIKDTLAYLRLLANPDDAQSFKRIVNVPPRGIGQATVEKLEGLAAAERVSVWEACRRIGERKILGPKAVKALAELVALIERLRARAEVAELPDLIVELLESTGYVEDLKAEGTAEAQSRIENLQQFIVAAREFLERSDDKSLAAFLDSVALVADIDELAEGTGSVTLMTLHSAKGLEFPVVFMTGMEEGIFPHSRSMNEDKELEEERRLCYVGMTRARERLFLTTALMRRLYNSSSYNLPSRFLDEVPAALVTRLGGSNGRGMGYESRTQAGAGIRSREPRVPGRPSAPGAERYGHRRRGSWMAKITREEVEHVARLARLALSDEEKAEMTAQLDAILAYMDKLNAIDTTGVEPTTTVIPMVSAMRDDVVRPSLSQDEALANAPDREDAFFRVPRIIEG
ncbi:MAG: Asp-tRNA(Asn)/Glu-tRNA(Gln) amidotransferase subunit GatC [Candidatus Methylomirabilales bacterium]